MFLAYTFSSNDQQLAVLAVLGILAASGFVFTSYAAAVLGVGPYTLAQYEKMLGFGLGASDEDDEDDSSTTTTEE
jgi:hypothetical protein